MKVNIYSIYSTLHNEELLTKQRNDLMKDLSSTTGFSYQLTDIDDLYKGDLALILVESGGSEHYFKQIEDKIKYPCYLLTFGNNNSLAASIEILSYILNKNEKGEILHGSNEYIAERIKDLIGK